MSESCALQQKLLGFCQAGRVLNSEEVAENEQLAELVKWHLRQCAHRLLEESKHRPVLFAYSSDATPVLTQTSAVSASSSATPLVVRRGKVLEELLMQRGLVKTFAGTGQPKMAVVMADPVPLSEGKKAWNLFSAACDFWPLLRRLGHESICIFHFGADRLLFTALDRQLRQRHQAFYSTEHGPDLGEQAPLYALTDWFVSAGCSLHDGQNGLKWGLSPWVEGPLVEDLHISIESLRNSFTHVHAKVGVFLQRHLAFADQPHCEEDQASQFWQYVGVAPHWIELFVEVNPRWEGGKLWANPHLQADPECWDKVSVLVMYLLKWKKFSETRWATVGSSCRAFLGSLLVGLDELVAIARADSTVSDFHLHGYTKCNKAVRRYVGVAAGAAYPVEAFLIEAMTDDRLIRRLPEVQGALVSELEYLENLGPYVWQRLASIVPDTSAPEQQTWVLLAAHTAAAFTFRRVLWPAGAYPWSLCQGDIDSNLAHLAESTAEVMDPTAAKIKALLGLGYNRGLLKDGLTLLREVPFSTQAVEQSHGSIATIHRMHATLGGSSIASRAMLHQARHLFAPSPKALLDSKGQQRREKLQRALPRPVTAKNVFFQDLWMEVKAGAASSGGSAPSSSTVLSQSHRLWSLLEPKARLAYEQRAMEQTAVRRQKIVEETQCQDAAAELQRQRAAEEARADGLVNHSSSCRFRAEDFQQMQAALQSSQFHRKNVVALRRKALEPPGVPSPGEVASLESMEGAMAEVEQGPISQWAHTVCRNRSCFFGCVLLPAGDLEDGATAYLFLYAVQSPLQATFLPMLVDSSPIASQAPSSVAEHLAIPDPAYHLLEFSYTPGTYCVERDVPFANDGSDVLVLQDVSLLGGGRAGSDQAPVPFRAFAQRLPPNPKNAGQAAKKAAKSSSTPELLEQYPWLAEYSAPPAKQARVSHSLAKPEVSPEPEGQGVGGEEGEEQSLALELGDEAIEAAWVTLQEKRLQWDQSGVAEGDNFYVIIRGGAWTLRSVGKALDSVMACARSGLPTEWAKQHNMGKSALFALSKYGDESAHMLALEWCRRCEHFFQIWVANDDPEYLYTQDDLASYQEDLEFVTWLCGVDAMSATWERAAKVRKLKPANL